MENNKKFSLISMWEEFKRNLLNIKEQNESVYLVDYEDLVKTMSDGYLINWVSIGSSEKLNREIQRLILERVKNYKNTSRIDNNLYDDEYYCDVIRGILEEKGIMLEILNSKPYKETSIYVKKTIEGIMDEDINNYIKQDELYSCRRLKRRLQ